jgi:TetR/AcrR family tetracycline transcriptional repressor
LALTRADIVSAAVALIDEGGLEHLSLRRLADRLGVAASTLYWHVRDKRQLLDLVAEEFMAAMLTTGPGEGEDLWAWLETWGLSLFEHLLAHPDGGRIMAGNRLTPESFGDVERILGRLAAEGLDPPEGLRALLALGAYIIGVTLDVQEEGARPADPDDDGPDPGRFPLLSHAGYPEPADRFLSGLRLLLAGIRASVRSSR